MLLYSAPLWLVPIPVLVLHGGGSGEIPPASVLTPGAVAKLLELQQTGFQYAT